MSLSWKKFKSALGSNCNPSCIMYVDDEGSEIPIDSEGEFQEALRLAKLSKNRLKLIFYDISTSDSQKNSVTFPDTKSKNFIRFLKSSENVTESPKDTNTDPLSNDKGNLCRCSEVPPKWFSLYMKKFKKALIDELKTSMLEMIEDAIEKEEKNLCKNSAGLFGEKIEASPAASHSKKKKKVSDKDVLLRCNCKMDFSEQRDLKLLKKLEKLQSTKSERLEKLDSKTKLLLEEKKKLLEKKRHSKSKLEKNSLPASDKKNSSKKSASFVGDDDNIYLYLTPGEEFTVKVNIKNDGKLPWFSPRLECYDVTWLHPNQMSTNLPPLFPNESCRVAVKGKVNKALGLHHFKCRVFDTEEPISTELTCWARVDYFDKYSAKEKEVVVETEPADSVEKLIDIDVVASSKKKIEENIIEIEKRLQFIDLLQPSTSDEGNGKKALENTNKVSSKNPECQTESCDLLQNSEEKEKNWTKRLEQEEVLFGIDCLRLDSEGNEVKPDSKTDENQKEKNKKDGELESSSDSEVSMLFMSEEEEEEEFIVIPLPSESPSPAESVHEGNENSNVESEEKPFISQEKLEPTVVMEQPSKSITTKIHKNRPQITKETNTPDNSTPNQSSPTRSRRSPFGEEIPKSKPKKMKSKSTEYHFTTANLTQPTFTIIPNGLQTERPLKFTFTGEKTKKKEDENKNENGDKDKKTRKKDPKTKTIHKTDASGRVIYAVNNLGSCIPVDCTFENGDHSKNVKSETDDQGNQNQQEKRSDRPNEVPSVNFLPNALVNGASNVASIAFNTAKSVMNNLQSAFVTEGKRTGWQPMTVEAPLSAFITWMGGTEPQQKHPVMGTKTEFGKPACEDKKKVSMENMFWLYDMGFPDLQLNRRLLLIHNNDLSKVIEELVQLQENVSGRRLPKASLPSQRGQSRLLDKQQQQTLKKEQQCRVSH